MFKILITEITEAAQASDGTKYLPSPIERYSQTVDAIDIKGVITAINRKPRGPRAKKTKETSNG